MKVVFRFIRNLIIIFLLALLSWHIWQKPEVQRQAFLVGDRLVQQLKQFTPQNKTAVSTHATKKLQQDAPARTDKKHILWTQPAASVYVNIHHNAQLRQAALAGIAAWNQTGVFHFKMAPSKKQAQITISVINDSDTNAAGQTRTAYNPQTGRLVKTKVQLNRFYLQNPWYNYSHTRIVNTVEHELGHAIGLTHKKKVSVMYPAGSLYSIQETDIRKVARIYHE